MRASKLRFPLSTAAASRPFSRTASLEGSFEQADAAVADAGGAAEADQVEAQRLQVAQQVGVWR